MKRGWLGGIDSRRGTTSGLAYQLILNYCLSEGVFLHNCLPVALSAHITDALAQPLRYQQTPIANVAKMRSKGQNTIIHHSPLTKVFAYTFENSRTIPLAFSALLFHVLVVLVHLAFVFYSRHPYYKTSWGTFGEILILALRSSPAAEARNSDGETMVSQMWKKTATVCAVGDDGQVQIVVRENRGEAEESKALEGGGTGERPASL